MSYTLTFELNKTAEWRARKHERHPEDGRNQTAVTLLNELAEQAADPDLSSKYESLHEDESISAERLAEVHSDVLSDIGFRWTPTTIDEVLERIIGTASSATAS